MLLKEFSKLLTYFDNVLIGNKTTDTGWNYTGIMLDYYFESSVLSFDYLDIFDYFDSNGTITYFGEKTFQEQFENISEDKRLQLIQNILNILNKSTFNKKESEKIVKKILSFLERLKIPVVEENESNFKIQNNDYIGEGTYCNISTHIAGIYKKELKREYINDIKIKSRFKYEFEMMEKLVESPNILKVFSFGETYYLMEAAEKDLYSYLQEARQLTLEEKFHIISEILSGVGFAHQNDIIHRDLHLANILKLDKNFVVSDFGLGKDESIVRSLKSSSTPKSNHIFVDPLALTDFTKLDKKSDIYSVGKIIEYIRNINFAEKHKCLDSIIDKCIERDKDKRFNNISEIEEELNNVIRATKKVYSKEMIIKDMKKSIFNSAIKNYILDINEKNLLSNLIVNQSLGNFGELIIKFDHQKQLNIMKNIYSNFSQATGYNGWSNYDLFIDIGEDVYMNSEFKDVKEIAYDLVKGCGCRFRAHAVLEKLDMSNLI